MRILTLPTIYGSKIVPFFSAAFASALPVAFPEAFSKALTLLGKLPLYSFSSFYGPLLSAYLTPAVAVVSVLSMPLTNTMTTPVFTQRSLSVAPASSTVTAAQVGAQDNRHSIEGSWHFRLQDLEATLGLRFHGGDRGMEAGMARSIATGDGTLISSDTIQMLASSRAIPLPSIDTLIGTSVPSLVTATQVGAQGKAQSIANVTTVSLVNVLSPLFAVASGGMTMDGMNEKEAGEIPVHGTLENPYEKAIKKVAEEFRKEGVDIFEPNWAKKAKSRTKNNVMKSFLMAIKWVETEFPKGYLCSIGCGGELIHALASNLVPESCDKNTLYHVLSNPVAKRVWGKSDVDYFVENGCNA